MEETKGLKEEFEKDREELEAKLELLDKMYPPSHTACLDACVGLPLFVVVNHTDACLG